MRSTECIPWLREKIPSTAWRELRSRMVVGISLIAFALASTGCVEPTFALSEPSHGHPLPPGVTEELRQSVEEAEDCIRGQKDLSGENDIDDVVSDTEERFGENSLIFPPDGSDGSVMVSYLAGLEGVIAKEKLSCE